MAYFIDVVVQGKGKGVNVAVLPVESATPFKPLRTLDVFAGCGGKAYSFFGTSEAHPCVCEGVDRSRAEVVALALSGLFEVLTLSILDILTCNFCPYSTGIYT